MKPSVQRESSSKRLRSRMRRFPSSTSDSDETEMSDDSSAHGGQSHPIKKNSTAKKRRGEGERGKGMREGRVERMRDESSSGEETDRVANGGRKVKVEPDDEEIEWPRSESDSRVQRMVGELRNMNNLMPAHYKRRSLQPDRFKDYSQPRSIASSTSSVDRNKKENKHFYQKLMDRSKKLGYRQKKKFKKRREDDQDSNVKDPQIYFEVYERGRKENADIWDERAGEEGDATYDSWTIDYLMATEYRPIGYPLKNETQVMIKWTNYPHPTWEDIKKMTNYGESMQEFNERVADMDLVEFNLRSTLGDAEFERQFPNRYLKREDGLGNFGYITNKRSHYVNRLRALESGWTFSNDRSGLPKVYIEDWTDKQEHDESLRNLQYTNYLVMTAAAKRKISALPNQLEHIKCEAGCGCCVGQSKQASKKCCDTNAHTIVEGHYMSVECTSSCGCDESCKNRRVQNGRQMRLSLFREPKKGWGVRVMTEVQENEFIDEYTGEMALEAGKHIYDFPGSYPARDESGEKLFSLVNRAGEKGNITRFFNHSCNPNLNACNVLIERYGCFYLHTGFFAARKIYAGEELTFNYFDSDENDISEMLPNGCSCGAKNCRMPSESFRPIKEEEDDVGGEEMDDGMPQEENDENMGRNSPRGDSSTGESTNEATAGMEEEREKRRPKKRPTENPFSPLRESLSREDARGDEEELRKAEERRPSLGGATQRDEETQSQEAGGRKKVVVRKEGGKKKDTVASKKSMSQKVKKEPRFDQYEFSSDDEEELRAIARRREERERGKRLMTFKQFQRAVAVLRKRKARQINMTKTLNRAKKEQIALSPIPFDRHSSVDSDEGEGERGIKRRAEEPEEDSEVDASTIRKSHERVKKARLASAESDRSISMISLD